MSLKRTFLHGTFFFGLYTSLVWMLLAFAFTVLPSNEPDNDAVTSALLNGERVTKVYSNFDPVWNQRSTQTHFIVRYQLLVNQTTGSRTLTMGAGDDKFGQIFFGMSPTRGDDLRFDLDILKESTESGLGPVETNLWAHLTDDSFSSDWKFLVHHETDRHVLSYLFSQHRGSMFSYRVLIDPVNQVLEIWAPSAEPSRGGYPLVAVHLSESNTAPTFEFHPESSSPSTTLQTRILMLFFLVPVAVLFLGALSLILSIFSLALYTIYSITKLSSFVFLAVALIWWLKNGRPAIPFSEFRDSLRRAAEARRQEIQASQMELEANRVPCTRNSLKNGDVCQCRGCEVSRVLCTANFL